MRKVDFDTATVDPVKLRELNKNELTLSYAIYHVMEAKLWEFANTHDAFDDANWKARNQSVTAALAIIGSAFVAQFPEDCFAWYFRGCLRSTDEAEGMDIEFIDDGLSHYDIEKSIENQLGTDGIMMDSESSWFYINTTDNRKEGLERFLRASFPRLEFSVDPADNGFVSPPTIGNWDDSAIIVRDAKVKVTIEMPTLTPKSDKEIDEILADAICALEMTGLSSIEAINKLALKMNVAIESADYI